jgi:hypothetical protein
MIRKDVEMNLIINEKSKPYTVRTMGQVTMDTKEEVRKQFDTYMRIGIMRMVKESRCDRWLSSMVVQKKAD